MNSDLEKKAKKSLDDYSNHLSMSLNEIYSLSQLNIEEIAIFEQYKDIIEEKLRIYAPKWLYESPELNKNNRVKYIAKVIIKCLEQNTSSQIRGFVKELFNNSMNYTYKIEKNSYRICPKSDQFEDIFFELELIEYFIDNNYRVHLNKKKLKNGKKAEFWVTNGKHNFYVEAKNINDNDLHDIIYSEKYQPNRAMGTFNLNDEQERLIRKRFQNQYKLANSKFKEISVNYGVFIKSSLPLGLLGKRLTKYINSVLNREHPEDLKIIGFFFSNKTYIYNVSTSKLETN